MQTEKDEKHKSGPTVAKRANSVCVRMEKADLGSREKGDNKKRDMNWFTFNGELDLDLPNWAAVCFNL